MRRVNPLQGRSATVLVPALCCLALAVGGCSTRATPDAYVLTCDDLLLPCDASMPDANLDAGMPLDAADANAIIRSCDEALAAVVDSDGQVPFCFSTCDAGVSCQGFTTCGQACPYRITCDNGTLGVYRSGIVCADVGVDAR